MSHAILASFIHNMRESYTILPSIILPDVQVLFSILGAIGNTV